MADSLHMLLWINLSIYSAYIRMIAIYIRMLLRMLHVLYMSVRMACCMYPVQHQVRYEQLIKR